MRIQMDGHLVEPLDLDVDAISQKKTQRSKWDPNNHLGSVRFESDPKDGKEGNLYSAVETSRKGNEKVTESSHLPDVDIDVDIAAEERRTLKIRMNASRLQMDPPLLAPTRQTSGRGNNHILAGHRTLQDEVDRTCIDVCYSSLLDALKSLVKGLDADDFSVDKFFGLQDPTSLDDVQASPDFEEDLRTNEHLRLQAEVRNLGAEPQRLTRSTRVCLDYEPTILPDVPQTDNPACPITLDLTVDGREDSSSSPQS
ncbi:hypothetical protein R1flu_016298 [Riccia fluitans]|uniref:Uncharacterized protein n=1 Tax=Riccia fluitans TaxID=41844 RepID=A0ABD1YQB2_9MARC